MKPLIAGVLAALFMLAPSAFANPAVDSLEAPSLVFEEGEGGYPLFRIPALTRSQSGTILAFAEGRYVRHDHGRNDIVLKRSADGGKTWGNLIQVHADKELVMVNPSPVSLESGRILVFYEIYPHGYHSRAGSHPGGKHKMMDAGFGKTSQKLVVRASDDDGKTWSKAVELQKIARKGKNIISAGSPANGIVLQKGKHKGRIVMPMFHCERLDAKNRTWHNSVLYSDDQGNSWKLSEYVPRAEGVQNCNECLIAETDEGHVIMNARPGGHKKRAVALSKDGGATWGPLEYSPDFNIRNCNCGLLKFSYGDQSRLFFSYNNSKSKRANGFLGMSKDDGKTWPVKKRIVPGLFGYSQMVKIDDQTLGLIYEPFFTPKERWDLYFLRIPISWIEE